MSTPGPEVYGDRYEPLSLIARGGMAEVWLAHDRLLDRTVALKVLFPELSKDSSFVERFRREAQAAANLNHPNIVSVYDWGSAPAAAGQTYFIVMEYIEGRPLSRLLHDEGPLLADRAAGIGADAAAALGFAHRNGVVHRDVKPGNVLISAGDHVKVTDFGIAQAANTDTDHLTKTGAVMGTATYFSPEQAQGLPVDPRSDVYSLGVVLYEMVTGAPPFVADSPVATAYKHVHEQPRPPTSITPELPKAFEAVVMQAMAKSADRRYPSAEELRADLLRFRQGRPVLAEPVVMPVARPKPAPAPAPPPPPPPPPPPTRAVPTRAAAPTAAAALPEPTEPEHHGALWGYGVLLAVLILALVVVLYLLGRQLSLFGTTGGAAAASVALPADLVGQKYSAAVTELNSRGITQVVRQNVSDATHPADTVISTSPAAGTVVNNGGPVTLAVASGPPAVTVPDVVGEEYTLAITQLKKAGFVVANPVTTDSDTTRAGQVISQTPAQLTQAHQGDTVTLTVSDGRGQVLVPDETGKAEAAAETDLQQAGFKVYVANQSHSATVGAGSVVKTTPPAGSAESKGSSVGLVISSGPGQVRVPYVDGETESAARAAIEDAGLVVAETTQDVSDSSQDGIVLSVSPSSGTTVQQGSTVSLLVGRYSLAPTTTSP